MRQMSAGRQMYPPGFGQIPPQMQPGMDMGPGPVPGGPPVPMQAPPPREKDPGEGGRPDRKEPGYPNNSVPDYLQGLPSKHQLKSELAQLDPKLAELQRLLQSSLDDRSTAKIQKVMNAFTQCQQLRLNALDLRKQIEQA